MRVTLNVDAESHLPQDHPSIVTLNRIQQLFGDKNLAIIAVTPRDAELFSPEILELVRELTEQLGALPGSNRVLLRSITSPTTRIVDNSSSGLRVLPIVPDRPLTPRDAKIVRDRVLSNADNLVGTVISRDLRSAAIYVTFDLTDDLPGYVQIHQAIQDVISRHENAPVTIALSGPLVIAASLTLRASQVIYYLPLSVMIIGLVHYHAFGNAQATLLPILTGVLATLWSIGLAGWLNIAVDPYNATTPILILALGAGHGVQILSRYHEELRRHSNPSSAVVEAMARISPVLVAAAIVGVVAFFSLTAIGTASMRNFGILTGFGILAVLLHELTTIPAARSLLGAPPSDTRVRTRVIARLLHFVGREVTRPAAARRILFVHVVILVICALLSAKVVVDTSFRRQFAESDSAFLADTALNARFAGTSDLLLLVESAPDSDLLNPAAFHGILRLQERIEQLPAIGGTLSFVDAVASLHRAVGESFDSVGKTPYTRERLMQYLLVLSLSGTEEIDAHVAPDFRTAKLVVFSREDSTRYGEALIRRVRELAAEELAPGTRLSIAGSLASNAALTEEVVRSKFLGILQVLLATFVVAAVALRSVLAGALVAVPLATSVLVNFGVMGALDVPMDISAAVVSALAVGLGADYAVYLLFRLREEYSRLGDYAGSMDITMNTSGRAILYVSTAVSLGYLVLCASQFQLFVQLGSLVALAMVTSSATVLLVIPALVTALVNAGHARPLLGPVGIEGS